MVVTEGQSSSKPKIIKNHFRTTLAQQRLDGLAFLSTEIDRTSCTAYNKLIVEFTARHIRKVDFVLAVQL
jgi:hypothetical protein